MNRLIAHYRSYHKTKKWPVRFIDHFMDCACVNSWLLYRNDCSKLQTPRKDVMDLHYFKMRFAYSLIQSTAQDVISDGSV